MNLGVRLLELKAKLCILLCDFQQVTLSEPKFLHL